MSQCPITDEENFPDVSLPLDVAETLLAAARLKSNPTDEDREAISVADFQIETAKENSHEAED
jgi:hypothetical protein